MGFDGGIDLQLIWPWQDRYRRFSWLKTITFALLLVPAIRSAYLFGIEDYGVVPLAGLTYWSGVWATVVLLMALAVTPAVPIFRGPALIDVRRMIGVPALAYRLALLGAGCKCEAAADARVGVVPCCGFSGSGFPWESPWLRCVGDAWLQSHLGHLGRGLPAGMAGACVRTPDCAGRRRPRSSPPQS